MNPPPAAAAVWSKPLPPLSEAKLARACERVCGMPCNFRVARDRATQQNAAVDGAVVIALEEAPH